MADVQYTYTLDDFRDASIELHKLDKALALACPLGRYSVFLAHSVRGHACPYVRMQLRYHAESWESEWRGRIQARLNMIRHPPSRIITVGDYFANLNEDEEEDEI